MALAIVQHSNGIHTTENPPSAVTLAGAPTPGNLLIALVGVNLSAYTVAAGWTRFDACPKQDATFGPIDCNMVALYRYAQGGDTATLPAFFSAASTYWTHQIWEVSGVSGAWDTDFLCSFPLLQTESNANICQLPIFADGLALTGTASYNANSNPSISGSWSLDDAANNNGNYGSAAGAHRFVSNGDSLDGAWTQGTSAPYCALVLVLTTTQPSAGVFPRHVARFDGNVWTSGQTVPWTPKVGNLLLAYWIYGNAADSSPTANSTSWTEYASAANGNGKRSLSLYRYVQGGDTGALPALATAGSGFGVVFYVELSGAGGVFATDHVSNKSGQQDTGASQTTTADTTTAVNQFGMLAFGNYSGVGGNAAQTGFSGYFVQQNDGPYGDYLLAFNFYPSSGSTVQATITPNNPATSSAYSQDIFQRGAGPVDANVNATGVSGAGASGTLTPSVSAALTGVSAAAAPGSPVLDRSVAISGVSAAGVAAAPGFDHQVRGVGVSAAGAPGGIGVGNALTLTGVVSTSAPGAVSEKTEPFTVFPVFSLMRNKPVPAIGAMSNDPVCVISPLPPDGPFPISTAVHLAGASAQSAFGTATPSRRLSFQLVGVASPAIADEVVAA